MNMKDIDRWDIPRLRANAARERARALHELHVRISAWLRSLISAAPARPRECPDPQD